MRVAVIAWVICLSNVGLAIADQAGVTSGAFANSESAPSSSTAPTTSSTAQSGGVGEAANQLTEIVVTAEKRTEDIQRAPAAITSVSGDILTAVGVSDLSNMSNLFPAARFEYSFGFPHLYVRGIGAEQDRITVDQLVNVFVDGVLLPREMGAISQSDVNAIELLPGPQGTLYGASSVGGVLNIRNNRPTQTDEVWLLAEYGNFDSLHVRGTQNVSVNDELALRGSVDYINHDPYETTGRWSANTLTARVAALYTPTDNFSAYVWALAYNDDSISQEFGVRNAQGNWIAGSDAWDIGSHQDCDTVACNGFANRPVIPTPYAKSHDYIVAGQFDWRVGSVTVTDIPSFLIQNFNYDISGWVFSGFVYRAQEHQFTNELKAYGDSGNAMQWLAGLYLLRNTATSYIPSSSYDVPQLTLDNVAPYGQLTYSFTDALRATAGARYTSTYKDVTFVTGPTVLPRTSATWSNVDWKAGIEYDLNSRTMLYLTAQSGSSPGTLDSSNVVNGRPNVTDLTKLDSLTVGWKSRLLDNRLQLNNEIFYYDYKDFLIQTVVCGNPVSCYPSINIFLNAPKLTSYGDQLDVRWLATAVDSFNLTVAATSAKTGRWITDTGDNLSGQELLEAPELTVAFGAQHVFQLSNGGSINLRADSYYSDGYWGDFETQPGTPVHERAERQKAYTTTNVNLTYHSPRDNWKLGLWARNLEDKAQLGPSNAADLGHVQGIGSLSGIPRTFGVQYTLNLPTASR